MKGKLLFLLGGIALSFAVAAVVLAGGAADRRDEDERLADDMAAWGIGGPAAILDEPAYYM